MSVTRKKIGKIIGECVMIAICLIYLIPFYYLVVNTFKNQQEASAAPMALPKVIDFENYAKAFKSMSTANIKAVCRFFICFTPYILIFYIEEYLL